MKHKIALILLLALVAVVSTTHYAAVAEDDQKDAPKPQTWHFKYRVALKVSQSRKRPLLVFVSTRYDARSWEVEQAVIKTAEFAKHAPSFTLCRAEPGDKDFAQAAKGTPTGINTLAFFDSAGKLLETVKWGGHPDRMLAAMARVASHASCVNRA